jgi:hypothetical protein
MEGRGSDGGGGNGWCVGGRSLLFVGAGRFSSALGSRL